MASLAAVEHKNQDATVYVGNLDASCDEPLLMELFAQVGRISSVHMPKDKLTSTHNGYGFVEFVDVTDSDYAMQVMNMVKLFGKPLRVSKSSLDKKASQNSLDVGANLFIGNLDPEGVDEKLLYDTFSSFGTIIKPPRIMRDDLTNQAKGFGFVSFDSFEASDMAIECMHNQYLCNRQIIAQYAFKSTHNTEETGQAPGGARERHGSRAERMLAANNPMRKFIKGNATGITPASAGGMPPPLPLPNATTRIINTPPRNIPLPPPPAPPQFGARSGAAMLPPPLPPPAMLPPPLPPMPNNHALPPLPPPPLPPPGMPRMHQ
jgi:splicing factor 3B subunit 4|eukprot:scaffold11980_cov287-Chaetoceros_neogracile.AAC.1